MDLRKVKKLIELAKEADVAELEISSGDEAIRIRLAPEGTMQPATVVTTPAAVPVAKPQPEAAPSSGHVVSAPMAGTFYAAPHPDAPPFVAVGDTVEVGQIVCIIESMKMMNEIRTDTAGVVEAVLVDNGAPIGTGHALLRIGS